MNYSIYWIRAGRRHKITRCATFDSLPWMGMGAVELQAFLDGCSIHDWYDGTGQYRGPDDNGLELLWDDTAEDIGGQIGAAMARDVIAEGMPETWTGLDPQDVARIPYGMDRDEVEAHARRTFIAVLDSR